MPDFTRNNVKFITLKVQLISLPTGQTAVNVLTEDGEPLTTGTPSEFGLSSFSVIVPGGPGSVISMVIYKTYGDDNRCVALGQVEIPYQAGLYMDSVQSTTSRPVVSEGEDMKGILLYRTTA